MSEPVLHVHFWAPAEGYWIEALEPHFERDPEPRTATWEGTDVGVVRWTFTNDEAMERKLVRGVLAGDFHELDPRLGDISDAQDRFWPRISFTAGVRVEPPADLLTLDHTEVVGGTDDLWFHFVPEDPPLDPYSIRYDAAATEGVWGIEEGYCEGGSYPAGWWVTLGPEPGRRPPELHSVF